MPSSPDLAAQLAAVRDRSTCRITTQGRKTGKPHTVTIWFLVEDGTIYLATLDPRRDWVRNLEKTPEVVLEFADLHVRGRVSTVDAALEAHIGRLLAQKYWMAWLGSWFGKGAARAFRVDGIEPVAR